MNKYFKTHPFAKVGIFALPMLLFTVLMELYFPKTNPDGFQSFIIAFEFTETPEQLHQLFNGLSADTLKDINIGNYIDFGFMVTYSMFLILFFKNAAKTFNKKWLLAGIPLTVIVFFADVSENVCLLQITGMYSPSVTDATLIPVLNQLHIVTWIKWGGLALIFALFSFRSMGKRIISQIEGVVFIIPFLFGFWALSNDSMGISRFTLSIALAFFLILFYCFWYKTKKIEKLKKSLTVK